VLASKAIAFIMWDVNILGPVKLLVGQFLGCTRKSEFGGHPPQAGAIQPEIFELWGRSRWAKTLVEARISSEQVFEYSLAACDPWM
jgi:hypothetical protein